MRPSELVVAARRSNRGRNAERDADELEVLAQLRGRRARLLSRGASLLRLRRALARELRDHARGREADAEQAALALRDHLEADLALVEPGEAPLELAERRPLGLADRLAGPLDLIRAERTRPVRRCSVVIAGSAGRASCAAGRVAAPEPPASARGRGLRAVGGRAGPARPWPRACASCASAAPAAWACSRAGHEALADRPEVRRDPVEEQADREVDDERDERERQRR